MPILNFTYNANTVLTNSSYVIASQPPTMTTQTVWLVMGLAGIALLLISAKRPIDRINDLAGIIASLFLLLTAVQSFAVAVVTSNAYITGTTSPYLGAVLTEHTVYHYDLWGVLYGVLFVLSLANLYLLWLDSKRITEQEQVPLDHMSIRPQSPAGRQPRDQRDEKAGGYHEQR